jgi:hypothetical protein
MKYYTGRGDDGRTDSLFALARYVNNENGFEEDSPTY